MDKYRNREQRQLIENLEKIKFPGVETPVYKNKLKTVLISHARSASRPAGFYTLFGRLFATRRRIAYALPVVALLLLLLGWRLFAPAPQIYAHIVLEINPAVRLIVDTQNNITGLEAMDPKAQKIFGDLDLRNKSLPRATVEITNRLYEQDLLTADRKILLVIYPVADVRQEKLLATLETVSAAVSRRLFELDSKVAVKHFIMEAETYQAAEQAGLMPSQYLRLLDTSVSPNVLTALFKVGEDLGIEKRLFASCFATIADLVLEMVEAGVSERDAVEIIKELLAAGIGIDRLEEEISSLLDNIDDGESPADTINRIHDKIESERIEEIIEREDERDEKEEDDAAFDNNQQPPVVDDETEDKTEYPNHETDDRTNDTTGYPEE